jgi:hypothetical protein
MNTTLVVPYATPKTRRALVAFAFLNFLLGVLLLRYFAGSYVLVKGFGAALFFLGLSCIGWLISGGLLWKGNPEGISLLKLVAIANTGLYTVLRALLTLDFGSAYRAAFMTSPNPGTIANQATNSLAVLTLMCFVYAATTIFLFLRFRQPLTIPHFGSHLRSVLVLFRPSYQGPRRWIPITIWSLCVPSYLSLLSVLALYCLGAVMSSAGTTAGSPGRVFYYLSVALWWFSIPAAALATLGIAILAFLRDVPSQTKWSTVALVIAAWVCMAVAYLLFAKM